MRAQAHSRGTRQGRAGELVARLLSYCPVALDRRRNGVSPRNVECRRIGDVILRNPSGGARRATTFQRVLFELYIESRT